MFEHKPVLLQEAINALQITQGEKYIDCNFGGGGHTAEIIKKGGIVLALDIDTQAIEFGKEKFKKEIENRSFTLVKANFREIDIVAKDLDWEKETVSGILYDLGLSTFQLKKENKGFSFEDQGILDMRVDDSLSVTASDLLVVLSEKDLTDLFYKFGEDPQSRTYAKAIKAYIKGKIGPFSAKEIAQVIQKSSRYSHSKINPATRVFQALRIAVNSELENLQQSLDRAIALLKPEGRIVIISFHSLEDGIAKKLTRSPEFIVPSSEEIADNPSSRSAKMRIYIKND